MSDYEIRDFRTVEELRECVDLQEETWGRGFSERVSPAILKVAQILGGVAAGAYDASNDLVGFVFGMTGVRDGRVVHWSDMLAVRRGLRDAGLGRRLKEYQRAVLLERGIDTMYWTFDPLQSRNAHLNLSHLGIVVREYEEDMYGDTDSPLHAGIGTDRFIALWLMDSPRVERRLAGLEGPPASIEGIPRALEAVLDGEGWGGEAGLDDAGAGSGGASAAAGGLDAGTGGASPGTGRPHPRPGAPRTELDAPRLAVAIPAHIEGIMRDDMDLARAWRRATRSVFTRYLPAGYEVRELVRGPRVSHYILERR
ncbi:MAG: hypothetical protein ACE5GJ_04205 [Gemmatimonadota bacterium]